MAGVALTWRAIPGNHDARDALRAAFAGVTSLPAKGPVLRQRDFGLFRVIGLDTALEGAHHGWLFDEGFAFPDRCLTDLGKRPNVVEMPARQPVWR